MIAQFGVDMKCNVLPVISRPACAANIVNTIAFFPSPFHLILLFCVRLVFLPVYCFRQSAMSIKVMHFCVSFLLTLLSRYTCLNYIRSLGEKKPEIVNHIRALLIVLSNRSMALISS